MKELTEVNEPWALELQECVASLCLDKTRDICRHMAKLGIDEDMRKKWQTVFLDELSDCLQMMQDDINEKETKISNEIVALLKKCEELCKDLRIPMPSFGSEWRPLLEEKENLEKQINIFEKLLAEKRKRLIQLHGKEQTLCKFLGIEPVIKINGPIPSEDDISQLECHIENLEELKFQREEEYFKLKEALLNYQEQLRYKPRLLFEKEVLSMENENFQATEENMQELKLFKERLEEELKEMNGNIEELMSKIMTYWEILEQDTQAITNFVKSLPNIAVEKLEVLKKEVKKLDAKIKSNIEMIVKKLRDQIEELWNKCRYTQEQKERFIYFTDEYYCKDLLHFHELEISKLQNYYSTHKNFFATLEKHDSLWAKRLEFENKAASKDRYKNRGGKLLEEEKQRNLVMKQLAQVENKLCKLAEEFYEKEGTHFLICGETVEQYLIKLQEELDKERKHLLSNKKEQRDLAASTGKSQLSLASARSMTNLHLRTPNSKRKLYTHNTPIVTPAKKSKLFGESKSAVAPKGIPKIVISKNTSSAIRKSLDGKRRKSLRNKKQLESSSSEYDDFKEYIGKQDMCRSSLMPEFTAPRPPPLSASNTPRTRLPRSNHHPLTPAISSKQLHF